MPTKIFLEVDVDDYKYKASLIIILISYHIASYSLIGAWFGTIASEKEVVC